MYSGFRVLFCFFLVYSGIFGFEYSGVWVLFFGGFRVYGLTELCRISGFLACQVFLCVSGFGDTLNPRL